MDSGKPGTWLQMQSATDDRRDAHKYFNAKHKYFNAKIEIKIT